MAAKLTSVFRRICFAPEEASRREAICPTGKSKRAAREALSSALAKNILVLRKIFRFSIHPNQF
jgi:hypothetical protein